MSDLQETAIRILGRYGEPATIANRSGSTVGTCFVYRLDPTSNPRYWGEDDYNAASDTLTIIFVDGSQTVDDGYTISVSGRNYVVHNSCPRRYGTTIALYEAHCRRL